MSEARDLVFFYNGVEMTDESIENVPVALPLPMKGGTMRRGRKVWTVVDVRNSAAILECSHLLHNIGIFRRAIRTLQIHRDVSLVLRTHLPNGFLDRDFHAGTPIFVAPTKAAWVIDREEETSRYVKAIRRIDLSKFCHRKR
jgi:hypothetical protein